MSARSRFLWVVGLGLWAVGCGTGRTSPTGSCATPSDCDDGLFCNGVEVCGVDGRCAPGVAPVLDDGIPCTVDTCEEVGDLVVHTPDDGSCDDADPCTADSCTAGLGCSHPVICECSADADCDDLNPCTDDGCTPGGYCGYLGNVASCDDGLYCNGADTCSGGSCSAHDGDPCAGGAECQDTCDEAGATCNSPLGTSCTADANGCTNDVCDGSGACTHPNNTASCDDGVFCNGVDTCSGGSCSEHGGDPCLGGPQCNATCNETTDDCHAAVGAACTDSTTTDCLAPGCDGAGTCDQAYSARAVSSPCDDGLFCTGLDACDASGGCTVHAGDPCSPMTCQEPSDSCLADPGDPRFVSIVTGLAHTCGLTANGLAYCWGDDGYGQIGNGGNLVDSWSPSLVDTAPITGSKVFVQLVAGGVHSCGLTADGAAYCWGGDAAGQLGNGGTSANTRSPSLVDTAPITGNKAFVQLVAGNSHSCGLTSAGVAYCWGGGAAGQLGNGGSTSSQSPTAVDTTPITGNKAFVQLAAGLQVTCGLTADGAAYCWGDNGYAQLGDGNAPNDSLSPKAVDTTLITGNKAFVRLVIGDYHGCGLTADGVAYCWGSDNAGQLGNGSATANTSVPSPVDTSTIAGNKTFVQLSCGSAHTCGLTAAHVAYCWGGGTYGRLGNGGTVNTQSPSAVTTASMAGNKAFLQVSAGGEHSCGVAADGRAYCWGYILSGQLGGGSLTVNAKTPTAVDISAMQGMNAFVQLASGSSGFTVCGVTAKGAVLCWGSDTAGQLGNGGASVDAVSPTALDTTPIAGNQAFVQVAGGAAHTCGLTVEGIAYCWGRDSRGQLGNGGGADPDTQSPVAVDTAPLAGSKTFAQLVAGDAHTCGLTSDGAAYCWGDDVVGQLGNGGTGVDSMSPSAVDTTPITGNKAFIRLAAGGNTSCGTTADGVAYCWGDDSYGALGNGGFAQGVQSPSMVDTNVIAGNKVFVELTLGGRHGCGVTADGVGYCWGYDADGQLGDGGTPTNTQSPSLIDTIPIAGDKAFSRLSGGAGHSCGITGAGIAYCWGHDGFGALGDGGGTTDTQSPSAVDPGLITGSTAFRSLVTGASQSCGLTADGVTYCFGSDLYGQLGNGAVVTGDQLSPYPVDVSGL